MAFQKPKINTIKADIKNATIYLRSTKKFGKTTLFRDVIIEKYGDPSRGLLVGCGNEIGYTFLDNINATQVKSYKDLVELKEWLINEKGKEHNIEIVAFDTGDELALIADAETIRLSNVENPNKKVKSIKAAFGGYTAGEKYSANNIIKPYINDLRNHGFGVWVIAHTKFKTIKEKGGLDEDGYMQLSSNLSADYESAFGDIFDVTLTGVIDRDVDVKSKKKSDGKVEEKRYTTDIIRKLYFRETPLIDAGGRFADGAVPEYLVFDKSNMAADFIKTVETGMELSKTDNKGKIKKPVVKKPVSVEEPEDDVDDTEIVESLDENGDNAVVKSVSVDGVEQEITEEETVEFDVDGAKEEIRKKYRTADADTKAKIKAVLKENGSGTLSDDYEIEVYKEILDMFT